MIDCMKMADKQMNGNVFGHVSSESTQMPIVYDSEDHAIESEGREDEEQNIRHVQTIELLVAAGYFRARIKGLSSFDKVVGGMTWCISTCNVDLDVDLMFQENSTIGLKIALTEKIVAALPKMKCPHRIEPHQIRGLDFINIYPVIRWLVKRAMEIRAEMSDFIRRFSLSQFNKEYNFSEQESYEHSENSIKAVVEFYRPIRKLRREKSQLMEEESMVQFTLLEYDEEYGYNKEIFMEGNPGIQKTETLEYIRAQEGEQMNAIMKSMAVAKEDWKLTTSAVGVLVGRQHEEIRKIDSQYAERQKQLEVKTQEEFMISGAKQHHRSVLTLPKQIRSFEAKVESAVKKHECSISLCTKIQSCLQEADKCSGTIEAMTSELLDLETDQNRVILKKLHSLVLMNENLKSQEVGFKVHCKSELQRLKQHIGEFISSVHDEKLEIERNRLIHDQCQADEEKLQKIRLLLAHKTREIATLGRKIDEVPSRAELSQYQNRFIELYSQMSTTHKETKQFFTLYNTLDDTKLCLIKEVNLLNSIHDNFLPAMSNRDVKEQFVKQFEQIIEGIKQNRLKYEKKKQQEKMRRDTLNDQHLELIEKERLYFKTVKDFKEECRKNETLLAKLEEQDA